MKVLISNDTAKALTGIKSVEVDNSNPRKAKMWIAPGTTFVEAYPDIVDVVPPEIILIFAGRELSEQRITLEQFNEFTAEAN